MKMSDSKIIFSCLCLAIASFYSGNLWAKNKFTPKVIPVKATAKFDLKKSTKPELKFFVMSYCPYGNQIEDTLRPVFDLIGNKADLVPHYIFDKIDNIDTFCKNRSGDPSLCDKYVTTGYFKTISECKSTVSENLTQCTDEKAYIKASNGVMYSSLHGRQEANQNVREMCAWKQVTDKKQWWDFVGNINKNCTAQNSDSCWEDQAKKAGLDTSKITECFNKEGIDLIEKEIALTTQYKVSSSPTVLINEAPFPPEDAYTNDGKGALKIGSKTATQDKYRTPNVIKTALCESMTKQPKECKTLLPELSGSAPTAGGCGI
ncbi:hypothetical protein KBC75_03840 [Candidatus Shapirobacteria bacterium]|nr:hypothetical protein [Candidatus Shapirobacteria bacterium]